MRVLKDIAFTTAAVLTSPIWGYRMLRTGKWRTDWPARFGRGDSLAGDGSATLLIHAVSVGEVNATRALVKELARSKHSPRIVISTTTDTGFATARRLYEPQHAVVRYPFDLSGAVTRFLDRVRPDVVALMELEVWPTMLAECTRRGIPVAVVSGRLSESSFKSYARVRPLVRRMFAGLAAVGAQTEEYAARFRALGTPAEAVVVTDTMKWDTAEIGADQAGAEALAKALGVDPKKPLVVAGSTGIDEEALLLKGCPAGMQFLIAPRKPERFEAVADLDPRFVRRSDAPDGTTPKYSAGRFLLDTLGELRKAYALADVAIVGRSFLGEGGSDPIEPLGAGAPVVIGPDHDNFRDVVTALEAAGALVVSRDPWPVVQELVASPDRRRDMVTRGHEAIRAHRGATARTVEMLNALLGARAQRQGQQGQAPAGARAN